MPRRFPRYWFQSFNAMSLLLTLQVESPTKLKDEEITVVKSDVAKAFNEHFNAYNVLAQHHFAEVTDVCCEDSAEAEVEDVNMDTDPPKSPSKSTSAEETDSPSTLEAAAEDTSNLQLAWEMLELAQMIYERKSKNVAPEKKREVMSALWEASSGLGEVEGGSSSRSSGGRIGASRKYSLFLTMCS